MNKNTSIISTFLFLFFTQSVFAQFNLKTWMNFEDGKIPESTILLHQSQPFNTKLVDYTAVGKPELLQGAAATECGRFGMEFKTDETNRYLCIVAPAVLQRAKLGETGRALFQADFFLDGQTNVGHTMSVVAMGIDPAAPLTSGQNYWKMYRLGVLGASKAFFSFTDGTPAPTIYLHEKVSEIIPGPAAGWHRLQFVIEGNKSITCYVDGIMTSYSPVEEKTLQNLQPGILIGAPAEDPITVYVDNLSIQWTMDPTTPMPASPWVQQTIVAEEDATKIHWYTNINEAVTASKEQGKPLLVLFYIPENTTFQELSNNILQNKEEARALLEDVIPVRIDANQLMGANLVQQYGVYRVPQFLLLDSDGTEKGRLSMLPGEKWGGLQPKIVELIGG